ncbi:hypothetical protein Vretimale_18708 [Volvox reticuliferus]|uniref:Uncharacterized protein n=1 Tax=Volvox reticuliferus TaxID=1737510 RepID=A0A8J4FUE3_9CHLO|nr:hypothetical protein Vretifemale_17192 [Volvox reticuliferus]GIM16032.1 hypothetical protein Vretimale_18708 [Volvox reticuliferus]
MEGRKVRSWKSATPVRQQEQARTKGLPSAGTQHAIVQQSVHAVAFGPVRRVWTTFQSEDNGADTEALGTLNRGTYTVTLQSHGVKEHAQVGDTSLASRPA